MTEMNKIEKDDKICVLGGTGFLGRAVCSELKNQGYVKVRPFGHLYDFRLHDTAKCFFENEKPDVFICLAANCGGIGHNQKNPFDIYYDNIMIGANAINAAVKYGKLKNFVYTGTVCSYPKDCPVPFKEEDIDDGRPEETNIAYGMSKKVTVLGLEAAHKQYGLPCFTPCLSNMFGEVDNFDPSNSHVIPAMLRKFHEAKRDGLSIVEIWGTGNATRDFLYVGEAAKALSIGMTKVFTPEPINLGSGREISIKDLVEVVRRVVGYTGDVFYNADRPDGQPRRLVDITKAKSLLGWEPSFDFEQSIKRTYLWWKSEEKLK